ncbi:hypothetical protein KMP13_09970 [Epibacterium ulvae]|uniref:hypothetical protein n=1 Tax=Epibacterium ulvae TaxID=1156985 RepID=UPI001BFC0EEC|nr:hypothetical protein [Epibacterium ulvae]MBT8154217.1 hypothetical protein [Epibacterium ulvae]
MVTFDSPDLDADLADLRSKGLDYASPMSCKLILPNDQIRYLTLDTGDISDETRLAEVRLALADATPYELHELAFDISADGTRTHTAAVAYETLQEAEHFAQIHGFNPASFVAQPGEHGFLGEPFFGPTAALQGAEVTPDGIAVVDIGPALLPEPDPVGEAVEASEASVAAENAAQEPELTETADIAVPDAPVDADRVDAGSSDLDSPAADDLEDELAPHSAANDLTKAASEDTQDAENQTSNAAPRDALPEQADDTPAPATPDVPTPPRRPTVEDVAAQLSARAAQALARDDLPDKVSPQEPTGLPESLDFSAVANLAAPTQDTPSPTPTAKAPKETVETPEDTPKPPVVGFTSRRTASPDLGAAKPVPATQRPASRIPTLSAVRSTNTPVGAAAAEASTAPKVTAKASKPPVADALAAARILAQGDASEKPDAGAVLAQIKPKQIAVPAGSKAARDAAAARAEYEAEKTGKPKTGAVARAIGGKPRFLGLMLTSLLLLLMAVVAAVAFWSDARFDDRDPAFETPEPATLLPDPVDTTRDIAPQDTTPTAPTGASVEDAAPAGDSTPAEQPLVGAAPDASPATVDERTDLAEITPPPSPELSPTDTAVLDALHAEDIAARPEPPETAPVPATEPSDTLPATDDAAQLAQTPPDVGIDPEAEADALALLDPIATPELDDLSHRTTYAATGIWQKIPEGLAPDATANRADLDDIYVASIDNSDLARDSIALPNSGRFSTDRIQNALPSPVPADSEFDLDERGLVVATPEGALNPDGVTIYLGRPAKVPPTRPEFEPIVEAPVAPQIARVRPRPRPADLQDRAERARFGGLNLDELAKVRPRARPAGLIPAVVEPEAPAVANAAEDLPPATALAVGNSVIPRQRPSNFQRLVARAKATPQPAAAPVAAVATVTPSIPSSANVAREATVANVIDLRDLNLIGISGSASDRRALVRMPSGRIRRVKVGDNIDGGRVTAIDNQRLLYQKRGRNHTLRLPNG